MAVSKTECLIFSGYKNRIVVTVGIFVKICRKMQAVYV